MTNANAKTEAIEKADAELNNAGLPTYSEMVASLRYLSNQAALSDLSDANQSRIKAREVLAKFSA